MKNIINRSFVFAEGGLLKADCYLNDCCPGPHNPASAG
jgi:hypothetical protein